jgi:hypothetical protein
MKTFLSINLLKTIDDVLVFHSPRILSWNELSTRINKSNKGPRPKWFLEINNSSQRIGTNKAKPNPLAQFWILKSYKSPTIIKIRKSKQPHQGNFITGRHFTLNPDSSLQKCTSCPLNSSTNECLITTPKSNVISLWTRCLNNKFFINNPIEELHFELNTKYIPNPTNTISIPLSPNPLPPLFFSPTNNIQTHTVIIKGLQKHFSISFDNKLYKINTHLHSSTTFSIIICHCLLNINASSEITFFSPFHQPPKPSDYPNRQIKYDNNTINNKIYQIISNKNIKTFFYKKTNHQIPDTSEHEEFLDLDSSTKKSFYSPLLTMNGLWLPNTITWLKICQRTENLILFAKTHKHLAISPEILANANKALKKKIKSSFLTSLSFRCKIIDDALPTREFLNSLYPTVYPNKTCPRCLITNETQDHIFNCPKSIQSTKLISPKIKIYIIRNLKKRQTNDNIIFQITNYNFSNSQLLKNIALTIFPSDFPKISKKLKIKTANYTLSLLHQEIWIPRCATANTSHNSGIKWPTNHPPTNNNIKNNNNSNKKIKVHPTPTTKIDSSLENLKDKIRFHFINNNFTISKLSPIA